MRILTLLLLFAAPLGAQATLDVPSQHPTIQAGLDAAQPGDTVQVAAGIYYENVQLREDVNLVGDGWRKTVIDGGGQGDVITADGVHNFLIDGFTLRGSAQDATSPGNSGIYIHGSVCCTFGVTARVERCRITNNGHGIQILNVHSGTVRVRSNVIDRNLFHGFSPYLGNSLLERNTIANNGGSGYYDFSGGGTNELNSNAIIGNGEYGVFRHASTPVSAAYNDVFGNSLGGYYQSVGGLPTPFPPLPGTGEISVDPLFVSFENGDYHPEIGSPVIDAGDPAFIPDINGSVADIGGFSYNPLYIPSVIGFGTGCDGLSGWFWEPIVGQPYFELHVESAPPSAVAIVILGLNDTSFAGLPLPLDLALFGAPGCDLLTAPVLTFPAITDPLGAATLPLPIPPNAVLAGVGIFLQWAVFDDAANPFGMVFSDGVRGTIQP